MPVIWKSTDQATERRLHEKARTVVRVLIVIDKFFEFIKMFSAETEIGRDLRPLA